MFKGQKKVVVAGSVLAGSMVAPAAFAVNLTTDIAAAATEADANLTAVIAAVLAMAILGFGVRAVIHWFK